MLGQLGLQAHISPADIEPLTKFGISARVDTTREEASITWIEVAPEHQNA